MTQTTQTLIRGTTNVIDLARVKDLVTGLYPTTLTCVLSLEDANGVTLEDVNALAMTHVTGTTGRNTIYRFTLPATVALPDDTYTAVIVATGAAGVQRTYTIPCDVVD